MEPKQTVGIRFIDSDQQKTHVHTLLRLIGGYGAGAAVPKGRGAKPNGELWFTFTHVHISVLLQY